MRRTAPAPTLPLKRAIDLTGAMVLLVVTAPLQVAVAVAVWLDLGRPVLFAQPRPGLGGEIFTLYKFRTMRDPSGQPGSDNQRLTRLGRFLRSTSLDELPSLWNVVRGEMSLVGPRPLLVEYLDRYTPEQARRHEVLPGITGWAQVNGRNARSWQEKLALDVWYVDHQSPLLDLRILLRTAGMVLRREGISAEGHATAPRFRGHSPTDPSGARTHRP